MRNLFKVSAAGETAEDMSAPDVMRARCCLNCTRSFQSLWAGERICKNCKQSSSWRAGISHGPAKSSPKRG